MVFVPVPKTGIPTPLLLISYVEAPVATVPAFSTGAIRADVNACAQLLLPPTTLACTHEPLNILV